MRTEDGVAQRTKGRLGIQPGAGVQNGRKHAPTKTPQVRALYPRPMESRGSRQLRANAIVLAVLILGVLVVRCAMDPTVETGPSIDGGDGTSAAGAAGPTLTGLERVRADRSGSREGSTAHDAGPQEDSVPALGLPTEIPWDLDVRVNELGLPVAGVTVELRWLRTPLPWDVGPTWRGRPLATGVSDATGEVRWRELTVPGPPRSRLLSSSLALVAAPPWAGLTLLTRPGETAWTGRREAGSVRFEEEGTPPLLVGQAGLSVERLVPTAGRLVAGGVGVADVRVMTRRPAGTAWTTTDADGRFVVDVPEDTFEIATEVFRGLLRDPPASLGAAQPATPGEAIDVEHVPVGWIRVTLPGTAAAAFHTGGLWLIEAGKDLGTAYAIQGSSSSFPLPPLGIAPRDHHGDTWRWHVRDGVTYDLWLETPELDGRRLAQGLLAGHDVDVPWPADIVVHELHVGASPQGAPIASFVLAEPGRLLGVLEVGSVATVIAARGDDVQAEARAEGYAPGHITMSSREGVVVHRHEIQLERAPHGVPTRFVPVDPSGRMILDDATRRQLLDPPRLIDGNGATPTLAWRQGADGTWRAPVAPGSWRVVIGAPLGEPWHGSWALVRPVDQEIEVTDTPGDIEIQLHVAGRVRVTCHGPPESAGHHVQVVELAPHGWRPTEPLKLDARLLGVGETAASDLLEPGPYVLKLRAVDEEGVAVAGGDIEREFEIRAAEWTEVPIAVP